MILEGNQRGGARDLALHLMKDDNEHVEVFDMRGFIANDLVGAFKESYALSQATKCRQHLFSLSLNPPPDEKASTATFENAVQRVEAKLGLENQPRAIVFHEKRGRRHAHAVWCRIDTQASKAIQLSFTKRKLMEISRELFIEHEWHMPRGMMASEERDPTNFTLAQWQQAKRAGKDAKQTTATFQDAWAISDTQATFASALKERGYILARGDRRGFVALDFRCDVYSVAKWVGIKARQVRKKLTDKESLPSVDEAVQMMTQAMSENLQSLKARQDTAITERQALLKEKAIAMISRHREERTRLWAQIETRRENASKVPQDTKSTWRSLWSRITGQHRKIKHQMEWQAYQAEKAAQASKDHLIFKQLEERKRLEQRSQRLSRYQHSHAQLIEHDIQRYNEVRRGKKNEYKLLPAQRKGPDLTI